MSRNLYTSTVDILKAVSVHPGILAKELYEDFKGKQPYKEFYNTLYRLAEQGYITKKYQQGGVRIWPTEDAGLELARRQPVRDGVWKLVIFDIPEKQKYVRTVLRAKLKSLHFQKWQNSIWVSPYKLDREIEDELKELSKKFFVRLIKTTDINNTDDLEKIFKIQN